jgi:cytochrome c2
MRLGAIVVAVGCAVAACAYFAVRANGTNAGPAPVLIASIGCGACHTIAGVEGANGAVGPSLVGLSDRRTIAGRLPNTPDNLAHWIEQPQEVDPGNLMPDLGLSRGEAAEIASYLDHH